MGCLYLAEYACTTKLHRENLKTGNCQARDKLYLWTRRTKGGKPHKVTGIVFLKKKSNHSGVQLPILYAVHSFCSLLINFAFPYFKVGYGNEDTAMWSVTHELIHCHTDLVSSLIPTVLFQFHASEAFRNCLQQKGSLKDVEWQVVSYQQDLPATCA